MARKKAAESEGEQVTKPRAEPEVFLPKAKAIKDTLNDLRSNKANGVDVAVEKRGILKSGEDKGIHKKAISQIHSLERESPEKLRDWAVHFFHYWEVSGLKKKAESAPSFSSIEEQEEAERKAAEEGSKALPGAGFSETARH